jgi:hypothetical protein
LATAKALKASLGRYAYQGRGNATMGAPVSPSSANPGVAVVDGRQ